MAMYFVLGLVATLLLPGLGHILIQRWKRAFVFITVGLIADFVSTLYFKPLVTSPVLHLSMLGFLMVWVLIPLGDYLICHRRFQGPTKPTRDYSIALAVIALSYILGLSLGDPTYEYQLLENSGESMRPNLLPEDVIFFEKTTDFQRGDIVAFQAKNEAWTLGRVVGLPGDRLEIDEKGLLMVNGTRIPEEKIEPYTKDPYQDLFRTEMDGREFLIVRSRDSKIQYPGGQTLEKNQLFVMGDLRDNARDSRFIGPLELDQVYGRGLYIFYSLAPNGLKRFGRSVEPRTIVETEQ